MRHSPYIAILSSFLALVVSACGGNLASAPISPFTPHPVSQSLATNEFCSNPLLPVKLGATWVYSSTGGPIGDLIYTDTITEIRKDGFVLTSQFTDGTHTQVWKCTPEGLLALQPGGSTAAGISTQGMTAEFTTVEITGLSLPRTIIEGQQWQFKMTMQGTLAMPGEQQSQSNGTYVVEMQSLGRETVTVPAGTFEAVKIQAISKVNVNTDFQGTSLPITFDGTSILWYAPNVGYIKSIENGNFSGTTFTTTTELQTYQIP